MLTIATITTYSYMKKRLMIPLLALAAFAANGQEKYVPAKGDHTYPTKAKASHLDNYLFSTYFTNGKKAFNLRNLPMAGAGNEILEIKINPSGTSFAMLAGRDGKGTVTVNNLWQANKQLHAFKEIKDASAIAYTPDAKRLLIAVPDTVRIFDAREFTPLGAIATGAQPSKLAVSPNGFFLAAVTPDRVTVYDLENGTVRKTLDGFENITDVEFGPESDVMAVLTADGNMSAYSTSNFFIAQSLDALGGALASAYHPEGKYLSVATGDSRIAVVNLMDEEDREYVDVPEGGISDLRYVKDGKDRIFMIFDTSDAIVYRLMSELLPNYTKLLTDELNDRMNEWMKRLPDESLEAYNLRVNEESRKKQARLFEEEIATRMADNLVAMSEVSLGNYNPQAEQLAIAFDNMPEIYLNVPQNEINDFMDPGNLEFRNAKYGLTPKDKFELIYAEVYNKASGKSYVFDNLERKSLAYLAADDNFVPLDIIQQSNLEEERLNMIKNQIMDMAKREKTISDHTQITVDTKVVPQTDASGKKVVNYDVKFSYEVEPGFSATEDFPSGKYRIDESGAARSMLQIVKKALEEDFAQYVADGKKLKVTITGMADAQPINGVIAYDGSAGEFIDEPVRKNGDLSAVTVTKKEGIRTNEQLAFVRGAGVRNYIAENVPALQKMQTDYGYNIELTKGAGGQYRRITVEFEFVDAF